MVRNVSMHSIWIAVLVLGAVISVRAEGWVLTWPDPDNGTIREQDVDVDARGYAHIAYSNGIGGISYASQSTSGWIETAAASDFCLPAGLSLDLWEYRGATEPVISHVSQAYMGRTQSYVRKLACTHRIGSSWETVTVYDTTEVGGVTSVAVRDKGAGGRNGLPPISISFVAARQAGGATYWDLEHAYTSNGSPSGWMVETVVPSVDSPWTSIGLDSSGYPHIAYVDDGALKYVYKKAKGWQAAETVCPLSGAVSDLVLQLESDGDPRIAFIEAAGVFDCVKHARRSKKGWSVDDIDAFDTTQYWDGANLDFALDSSDGGRILYTAWVYRLGADMGKSTIRYAYEDTQGWVPTLVRDIPSRWAESPAIALDDNDVPHMTYVLSWATDIEHATGGPGHWSHETAVTRLPQGYYLDLDMDGSGYPHISHWASWPNNALRYTYEDENGWHTETADQSSEPIYETSIAVQADGAPHISYCDYRTWQYELKCAYRPASSSAWTLQAVDTGATQSGWFNDIALDSDNRPYVAYACYAPGEGGSVRYYLRCAHWNGQSWEIENVDEVPVSYRTGQWCSLAIDADGYPHIAFTRAYTSTDEDLWYAYKDENGWHTSVVVADTPGQTGTGCSLALGLTGERGASPHITYLVNPDSPGSGRVRHAWRDAGSETWQFEDVDSTCRDVDVWATNELTCSGGDLHVSYWYYGAGCIAYKTKPRGGSWSDRELIDDSCYISDYGVGIGIGWAGTPVIAYHCEGMGQGATCLLYNLRVAER